MSKNQLKVYHRAYRAYQKEISQDKACQKVRRTVAAARAENESIDCTRFSCTVDKDWVEKIEFAMPYVEKAVMQNRQFILQNGETVLIEQAKKVSRASVEHLAQHSQLITRKPEAGEDLLPEKIYVVENTENYAIYENRFLFLLLTRLREFVDVRYEGVIKSWNTFRSELCFEKKVRVGKRAIRFSLNCTESAENEATTSYDGETLSMVERIGNIQQSITLLLNTPLMKGVSHAPALKPPITRTNVLRMDPCFREAMALYDFITEYTKDGYTVNEIHENTTPFSDALEGDLAEVVSVVSYLTYRHGGRLDEVMEREYLAEEKQRRDREEQETLERLAQLKKKAMESASSMEEYMRLLEERNTALEAERDERRALETRASMAENSLDALQRDHVELQEKRQRLEEELAEKMGELQRKEQLFEQEKRQLQEAHEAEKKTWEQRLAEWQDKYDFTMAQLHGLRQQHGLITEEDDYSSKERFAELEREYAAFRKFFSSQWKSAKKGIRKRILWSDSDGSKKDTE